MDEVADVVAEQPVQEVKRKRGRPRTRPEPTEPVVKRKRGRPRTVDRQASLNLSVSGESVPVSSCTVISSDDKKPKRFENRFGCRGPFVSKGLVYLSSYDQILLERGQLSVANARQGLRINVDNQEKTKFEAERKLEEYKREEVALLQIEAEQFRAYDNLKSEIEKLYEIDLKEVTWDKETGLLKKNGAPISRKQP